MVSFILSKGCISLMIKGRMYQIRESNRNYDEVKKGLKTLTDDQLLELVDVKKSMAPVLKSVKIEFREGLVYADGKLLSTALTDRYKKLVRDGMPTDSYENFIKNVFLNPSEESVKDLYGFLEACSLPITEDGCFLAYKRINSDWTDCHTGKISNKIGKVVKMPRENVNADRHQTCSTGLHVCSLSYLNNFSGDRTIIVKVNPANVVSVPTDYHNAKMRVCEYEVIEELKNNETIPDDHVELDKDNYEEPSIDPALVDGCDLPTNIEEAISSVKDTAIRTKIVAGVARLRKFAMDRDIPQAFYDNLNAVDRRGLYKCAERIIGGKTIKGSIPHIREAKTLKDLEFATIHEMVVQANKKK